MNCFETMKISQQYSKIIQKIQQRNDKDPKNKKSNLIQISKTNKQNILGTQNQLISHIQNNTKPNSNLSCNQTINSTTSSIQKGQQQIKDKSPSQTTPRYNYTPLTPLKNLIGNNSSLSPLPHLQQQQIRNVSKTIHYPQNQQQNNNVSNTILNTTNMLEDNSFVSINNHLSNIQQEIRISQKKPYLNDQDSTQKALSQRLLVNNYDQNSQNTPKRLFFNYKNTVNESLKNHSHEQKNQQKELINFKCSLCQMKNAKYQSKITHNTGEYTKYYCSKCAIKLMEQGQKMDCIPNIKTPQSQLKNQQSNYQQKNQQEEIQLIHDDQDSSAHILKNVQLENFSRIDQKQHSNKQISQLEFPPNFQFDRKESPNKHSSNQKENIFLPTLGGVDCYQNDALDNSQRNLQLNQIAIDQLSQKNQQVQIKQQIQNHNGILSDSIINHQLINGCNQNLFSQNQQIQLQSKQDQNRMQVWNFHDSENQDDQKWQDLGPKLTFEGESQRPSDQDLFNIQQQDINRAIIVFNDSENNQQSKNIQDSEGQEEQSDSNQKDSDIATISQVNPINHNNSLQKEDDNRQMIMQQEQIVDEDSQSQFLPQFSDQSNYEQSRQRKIQILENFSQELNLSNTRAAACLNQLAQRKKEVTKFYENQELKLQQNAQNLMQFIQQELNESIEKLRNAQVKTLSLFAEKEHQLQRIYHEIQSTELDVKKNRIQIVEFMEEQPFNNIIQIYHQNLSKNTYTINELPNQILCLSKTYQLAEKKQASALFQQGLKDALVVQEKRTTMFGNSSYASATSTPQTASTNNNSYNLVISPRSSNNQNINQFNFVNNQNMLSYQSHQSQYQTQKRNLSQTNSMTSSKVFTSQSNQTILQNQPTLNIKQNSQQQQFFSAQVNNPSPLKKQNIDNSYVQEESQQLPQSSDFGNNNQNQFQNHENIQSSFSQQNQNFQQISNNFSLQNSGNKSQFKPIISNSISSPLIKKNNSLKNIQNYPIMYENQYIQNPYSSVENHFEQIYKPDVTRENAPSYSSVQFQRWKDCEKTIIEQIMSIEQNEMNLTPGRDSKQDIELLSPCQQSSKISGIVPQNLFQSPIQIQHQNNEISIANQKNDFAQDEIKCLSDYEKKIQSQINQQNNTQQIQNIDNDQQENQDLKQVKQEDFKKQGTSKFEDIKNNYQWMIEQYKMEQNLVSSHLVPQEPRNAKKVNSLAVKQNLDNLAKGSNQNQTKQFEQNKIIRERCELQDITYLKLQQNDQIQNKLLRAENNNQLIDEINLSENLINKAQFKQSSNQSYSSNNQTGEFQLNDHGIIQNQNQAVHSYGDQYSDQIAKDKSISEGVDLSYSVSVAAGLASTNDQMINNPNSQSIQNSNNLFKIKSYKQEEQALSKDGQFCTLQPLCQSNLLTQQEQKQELYQDGNKRETSINQIDLISNSDQQIQIQKENQNLTHLNRQNLISSFSQNIKLSDDLIETSIVQNYINRESFSQNNDQTSYYSQNTNQFNQQLMNDQNTLNQFDKKAILNEYKPSFNNNQNEANEDKNIQFIQSTTLNYPQMNKNEIQLGFSINIQQSQDDKIYRQLQNIAKDSFSDANYTIQHQESQEEQNDQKEDIILDINQLHDISGDEDTDSGLGSNASKRPLKYSEIIQKIHENYNRLSQNCQKKSNNLQKNQSQPTLSQENQQETHQANQQKLNPQECQNNENNLDSQQQNFKTEESQLVFSNQEQIHLEIAQNLSDLVLNKNNENFSSFCTNMNQLEQSLTPMNNQQNEQVLQNDIIQISIISPHIKQNEIIDQEVNFIQNSQKESENYVNTVASFSQQQFEQQHQELSNNNYPSKEEQYVIQTQINNTVEVSPNSNKEELIVNQDKDSTFSRFLDNYGCVSTNIEAQINDHINNQISQKRINFNKYSELIKSSPHFRAHKFTEDSVLSDEDDNLDEEQFEVRSTPFK
ncbi:endo-1,4-beta-xylanase xylA, putative (macronuclear) [Tetrahymena thermophila SB210]|uniref:Endo-1,4-beta-xylanase xylA, putative n=1 Tax=Tetrahymena thermophila (strain SB210) TaxID=312017 RepID=I7MMV2_TETTS|nr:endo-1,4-beta-xylanase xylA, putative [Tetrahymena thermophila SB210]EAS07021.2 endo-1,4-beta-xylanase xylA, putative [Tetrahymena thermophila SB210]|eukprot:XP_001027263.2 endo-1,4-beta-xylanase xylA, putative [Tetrahymena thermophila SB210]